MRRPRGQLEPPRAHLCPLRGRAETSETFNQEKRMKDPDGLCSRIRSGPEWRIRGLTVPFTFRHYSSLPCSRAGWQDTEMLMDISLAGLLANRTP